MYAFGGGNAENMKAAWEAFHELAQSGKVKAAWAVEHSTAEAIMNMSFGNRIGFTADAAVPHRWYGLNRGTLVAELMEDIDHPCAKRIGITTAEPVITICDDSAPINELLSLNEAVLADVYPTRTPAEGKAPVLDCPAFTRPVPKIGAAKPKVLIPVFPGTNCEYDSARAAQRAGLETEIFVINNQSAKDVSESAAALA